MIMELPKTVKDFLVKTGRMKKDSKPEDSNINSKQIDGGTNRENQKRENRDTSKER